MKECEEMVERLEYFFINFDFFVPFIQQKAYFSCKYFLSSMKINVEFFLFRADKDDFYHFMLFIISFLLFIFKKIVILATQKKGNIFPNSYSYNKHK